jgi:hypothetical protein
MTLNRNALCLRSRTNRPDTGRCPTAVTGPTVASRSRPATARCRNALEWPGCFRLPREAARAPAASPLSAQSNTRRPGIRTPKASHNACGTFTPTGRQFVETDPRPEGAATAHHPESPGPAQRFMVAGASPAADAPAQPNATPHNQRPLQSVTIQGWAGRRSTHSHSR